MASLEFFDNEIKELVNSSKLSSSKIKTVTDAAMANIASDGHIVATLFKVHKQAKGSHKISSLYVIDAIAREAKQQVKKASKGKQSTSNSTTPLQDGQSGSEHGTADDDAYIGRKGTYASFLTKVESFLERLVVEVLTKGPPEHKEKVKKVLDIWKKSSTFSSEALKACYAKLDETRPDTDVKSKKTHSNRTASSTSGQRSKTPPYPPPDGPVRLPPLPATSQSTTSQTQVEQAPLPSADIAALLSNISSAIQPQPGFTDFQPPPQQAPPAFEMSQLALLQQLAAQTNGSGPSAPLQMPPQGMGLPGGPVVPMPPASVMPPIAPIASTSAQYPSESGQDMSNQWQAQLSNQPQSNRHTSPSQGTRDRSSRWDANRRETSGRNQRSRSPEADRNRYQRDRSSSPNRRRSSPRRDHNDMRNNFGQDHSRNEQGRSQPYGRKEAQRNMHDTENGSTATQTKNAPSRAPLQSMQNDSSGHQGQHGQQVPQNSLEEASEQIDLLSNAAPFNAATFSAVDPASWASFAVMCAANMGRMPSNMEMMQWIMSCMSMMQAAAGAQMGGGTGAGGNLDMQGFMGMGMGMGMQGNMNGGGGNMPNNQQNNFNQQDFWEGNFDEQQSWAQDHKVSGFGNTSATSGQQPGKQGSPSHMSPQLIQKGGLAGQEGAEGEADMRMTPE